MLSVFPGFLAATVPRFLQSSTRRYFSGDVWHKFSGANFCYGSAFRVFVGLMGEMLSISFRFLAATIPRFFCKIRPEDIFQAMSGIHFRVQTFGMILHFSLLVLSSSLSSVLSCWGRVYPGGP